MLFGDQYYAHLPEEAIEILIDNGVATAEWEAIGRRMQAAHMHKSKNTFYGVMKRYGLPMAALGTLFGLSKSINPMRPMHPKTGSIRGTSFCNLQCRANQDLKNKRT